MFAYINATTGDSMLLRTKLDVIRPNTKVWKIISPRQYRRAQQGEFKVGDRVAVRNYSNDVLKILNMYEIEILFSHLRKTVKLEDTKTI